MTKYSYLDSEIVRNYGICYTCKGKCHPFMLTHKLWKQLVPKKLRKELICIKCVESTLGRHLEMSDFLESQPLINRGIFGFDAQLYCLLPSAGGDGTNSSGFKKFGSKANGDSY